MDEHEAQRRKEEGEQLLEALGDVPVTYGFACELPAVQDEPLAGLDRLWYDRFTARDRDWLVVLNGADHHLTVDALGCALPGGAALVVCDNQPLAQVTPVDVSWHRDPDTDAAIEPSDIEYWDDELLRALHARLTENGKDLPDIEEVVSNDT